MKPMLTYCSLCHHKYQDRYINQVAQREHVQLFHLKCVNCGKSSLSYSIELPDSLGSVSLVTDMSYQDAVRFQEFEPISLVTNINSENNSLNENLSLYKAVLDNFGKLT